MEFVQTWIEFFMNNNGGMIFGAIGVALAVGLAGIGSGIAQGRVAAAGIQILAKKPEHNTKGIILSAMVETYALLGFVISFMLVNMI